MPEIQRENKKKELKLIKTLWGIDEPISPELFRSIKEEGYHGVEVIRLAWCFDDGKGLVDALNQSGLAVVCQVHTAGGYLDGSEYVYCGAYAVETHKQDFSKQLQECNELIQKVEKRGFINVHAGVDAWSNDEAVEFLEFCLSEIEQKYPNTSVTFETHRQRLFGSPFQTRILLSNPSVSNSKIRLNADLSHWYCACERVFNENDARDQWWPALLSSVGDRCAYIHARFGWAQGPQMADPSAPECEPERLLQLDVWKKLMAAQNDQKNDNNPSSIFVSPEYGPAPYMAVIPHSQKNVASLPDAVAYTKKQIEEVFESL